MSIVWKEKKDKIFNAKNIRFGEIPIRLFETNKNTAMPHGKYMFQTEYETAKERMCAYSSSKNVLPHWKHVLRCSAQFSRIDLSITELVQKNPNVIPTINVYVYQHIVHCTVHVRHPFN